MPKSKGFWPNVDKSGGIDACWPWTSSRSSTGYGIYGQNNKQFGTHRYAYELEYGLIPVGLQVLHMCDNRACCNPAHMTLGTIADNQTDKTNKGRQAQGYGHGMTVVNHTMARRIRKLLAQGRSKLGIAKELGISNHPVKQLAAGIHWTDNDPDYGLTEDEE